MPELDRPPLVLDTHVWIWTVEGVDEALADAAIAEIEDAARTGRALVSAIAVWETAMLEAHGRLSLSRPVTEWVHAALSAPGIRLAELTPDIAADSTRLPGTPPRDPADRMIIATSRALGATLVTCDRDIVAYGRRGHVTVRDARPRR